MYLFSGAPAIHYAGRDAGGPLAFAAFFALPADLDNTVITGGLEARAPSWARHPGLPNLP
jgi:hypothetical protein